MTAPHIAAPTRGFLPSDPRVAPSRRPEYQRPGTTGTHRMQPAALAALSQLMPVTRETQDVKRCTGCNEDKPIADFGIRKDHRENTRCTDCRRAQAQGGGWMSARKRKESRPINGTRDVRALRTVERYSGFRYREWLSPEAKRWQARAGVTLQELWSYRMRTLYARAVRAGLEEGDPTMPRPLVPRRLPW